MTAPVPKDFNLPSSCRTVTDVRRFVAASPGKIGVCRSAAAFEMASAAWHLRQGGLYYRDGLRVLDALVAAKAEIDIGASHVIEVTTLTAAILYDTQQAVHDATIPCTEWLNSHEIADVAVASALRHAGDPGAT